MPWKTPQELLPAKCGFVFAATGAKYVAAAEHAAESLRQSNPGFEIDLFTGADETVSDGLFDQIHTLETIWFRPKFESLVRARFDRVIYLDADIRVVADVSDVFDILERFDFAASHVTARNQGFARITWRKPLPSAFPQINGGVLGMNVSERTVEFIRSCEEAMKLGETSGDQPVFREMFYDSDMRLAILPPEYNARNVTLWRNAGSKFAAPRILHNTAFVSRLKPDLKPLTLEKIYGHKLTRHFERLRQADRTLDPKAKGKVPAPQYDNILFRTRDRVAKLVSAPKKKRPEQQKMS